MESFGKKQSEVETTKSSISLPQIIKSSEVKDILKFEIQKVDVSIVNALRRTLLSDIPTVVFRTFPDSENRAKFIKNTCRFHNEILKQRLGCIPIHIKDLDIPIQNLIVEIKEKNDTDSIRYVTTRDFQIKDAISGKYLSADEREQIFPPDALTKGYILFTRLKPRISADIPGEEIDIECKLDISTAKDSGMYNTCSTVSYQMTTDPILQNEQWRKIEKKFEDEGGLKEDEIETERLNWFNHDAKRYIKPDVFSFVLETIGVFSNIELIQTACEIINEKLEKLKALATQQTLEIITSKTTLPNCFDIILKNEGYTIGKVIEYIIHHDYFLHNKIINFVGFNKEHPHDDHSLLRISFMDVAPKKDKAMINNMIEYSCRVGQQIFKTISEI